GAVAVLRVLLLGRRETDRELIRLGLLRRRLVAGAAALVLVDGLPGVRVVRGVGLGRDVVRLLHAAVVALAPDADGCVALLRFGLLGRGGRQRGLVGGGVLLGRLVAAV